MSDRAASLNPQPLPVPSGRACVCIGIAVYPDDGADPEALLAHADRQMYRVKRNRDAVACVDEPA